MSNHGYRMEICSENFIYNSHNNSTISEHNENDFEAEMELRNNLEDVVGPNDISSDEEINLSEEKIHSELRSPMEGINYSNYISSHTDELRSISESNFNDSNVENINLDNSDQKSSSDVRHPFDYGDNSVDFPQEVNLPESPTDLHIDISQITSNLCETKSIEIGDLREQLEHVKLAHKKEVEKFRNEQIISKTKIKMMSANENRLKSVLVIYEDKVNDFNKQLVEKSKDISNLEFINNTLKSEVECKNSTISSLEQHVMQLNSVKSLTQSKQLHEEFIQKLKDKSKEALEESEYKYKSALSKIENLEQEAEMFKSELQSVKERNSNILKNNELTITSLQLALKNVKSDVSHSDAEILKTRSKHLEMKLHTLQNKYELSKKLLDGCDVNDNKSDIPTETEPVEDALGHIDLKIVPDTNNLRTVSKNHVDPEKNCKESVEFLKIIGCKLKTALLINKKIKDENFHLQKILCEKNDEMADLQIIIEQQSTNRDHNEEDHGINLEFVEKTLQKENDTKNKIKVTQQQIPIEKLNKSTNTDGILDDKSNEIKSKASETTSSDGELSTSLIDKYQTSLENEKIKTQELELFYKNKIKELVIIFKNRVNSSTNAAYPPNKEEDIVIFKNRVNSSTNAAYPPNKEEDIVNLKLKVDSYVKEIESIKIERKQLINHYENVIEKITGTLLDKEGEIQEKKNDLKNQISSFSTVIHELNLDRAKLAKKNETIERKMGSESEYHKGKLSKYREKYQSQGTSFDKYRGKVEERMKYYQGVVKEMEIVYNKDLNEVRSWLNASRQDIIKNIDANVIISSKLISNPISYEISKDHVNVLKKIKELVLNLNIKDSEKYFIHFN